MILWALKIIMNKLTMKFSEVYEWILIDWSWLYDDLNYENIIPLQQFNWIKSISNMHIHITAIACVQNSSLNWKRKVEFVDFSKWKYNSFECIQCILWLDDWPTRFTWTQIKWLINLINIVKYNDIDENYYHIKNITTLIFHCWPSVHRGFLANWF